jgi:hypothetical protein
MWINGRRAVRPDGGFYRGRRVRGGRGTRLTATAASPERRAGRGALVWIVGGVVSLAVTAFFVVRAVW